MRRFFFDVFLVQRYCENVYGGLDYNVNFIIII